MENDIKSAFGTLYHPITALVFYRSEDLLKGSYVECFDMDRNGLPVNAHPLTVREAGRLAQSLRVAKETETPVLKSDGIMAANILQVDTSANRVVWYTKAMQQNFYFRDGLGIPNGRANVPALLWVADRNSLNIYALKSNRRPKDSTPLYHAPFFNVYADGNVCMGTVDVRIKKTASLKEFTTAWEGYFFNSYFSHLVNEHNPVNGNCVSLWKSLIENGEDFPKDRLIVTKRTIKKLLLWTAKK
ncbi:PRTRC system protein B [Mucilaginibacter defluvii]|uniref:Prokaryotic E2 ligase family D protein n=1 Tax=Mucilaginibacter defluvii TaxID=1196019 RepID=A0ABP9FRX3_9SPHI